MREGFGLWDRAALARLGRRCMSCPTNVSAFDAIDLV
jgi:hypothetical protein